MKGRTPSAETAERRIRAALKAVEGIPTHELERGLLHDVAHAFAERHVGFGMIVAAGRAKIEGRSMLNGDAYMLNLIEIMSQGGMVMERLDRCSEEWK